jgi:uncharacterized membrane protein YqiK
MFASSSRFVLAVALFDVGRWLWDDHGFASLFVGGMFLLAITAWLSVRYIPNNMVGIVEKLWSLDGSVPEGSILALRGEAGFQSAVLRGGLHFGLWRFQYRIHKVRLVTVPTRKIGYVYARDHPHFSGISPF